MTPQPILPGIRVEAEGEAAERILACVQACEGIPTAALQAGWLKALLDELEEGYATDAPFDHRYEMDALDRLGRLGGPTHCADCEKTP